MVFHYPLRLCTKCAITPTTDSTTCLLLIALLYFKLTTPVDLQHSVLAFLTFFILCYKVCLKSMYFELVLFSRYILPSLFPFFCFLQSFFVSFSVSRVRVNSFSILLREIVCEK